MDSRNVINNRYQERERDCLMREEEDERDGGRIGRAMTLMLESVPSASGRACVKPRGRLTSGQPPSTSTTGRPIRASGSGATKLLS